MPGGMAAARIAVVGHVEHVTLGRVEGVPAPGDIVHLREPRVLAGGGGGVAFAQLCRSDAEVHLFTAIGRDEAGRAVEARVRGAGGRTHVHAAVRDVDHPRVVVLVEDEGCGIPPDLLGRIFDPFFTTKRVGEGTGLGLSIAYEIVRRHGGQISVESEPGRGTRFRVELPAAA